MQASFGNSRTSDFGTHVEQVCLHNNSIMSACYWPWELFSCKVVSWGLIHLPILLSTRTPFNLSTITSASPNGLRTELMEWGMFECRWSQPIILSRLAHVWWFLGHCWISTPLLATMWSDRATTAPDITYKFRAMPHTKTARWHQERDPPWHQESKDYVNGSRPSNGELQVTDERIDCFPRCWSDISKFSVGTVLGVMKSMGKFHQGMCTGSIPWLSLGGVDWLSSPRNADTWSRQDGDNSSNEINIYSLHPSDFSGYCNRISFSF